MARLSEALIKKDLSPPRAGQPCCQRPPPFKGPGNAARRRADRGEPWRPTLTARSRPEEGRQQKTTPSWSQ
ncbi:hypothetical protein MRX96_030543 [Rhipicephalus microplus]